MKKIGYLFLLFFGFIFISCSTTIDTNIQQKFPPTPIDLFIPVYDLYDYYPDDYFKIGSISIGDTGFTVDCSYSTVLNQAIEKCREMGGEAIWITSLNEPDYSSTCYRISVDVLRHKRYKGIDVPSSENDTQIVEKNDEDTISLPEKNNNENVQYPQYPIFKFGLTQQALLGFSWFFTYDDQLKVTTIHEGANAKGYLEPGDIISSINGIDIHNNYDAYKVIYSIYPGEEIVVNYQRKGIDNSITYQTNVFSIASHLDQLVRLCLKNDKVKVLLVVSSIENNLMNNEDFTEQQIIAWKDSVTKELISQEEANLVISMKNIFPNFSLVDRSQLDRIIEEQKFSMTGLSQNSIEIGNILEATHILNLSLSRFESSISPAGYIDSITMRLIDVQTSEVVASVTKEQI